jgi:hypothetical protein
LLLVFYASIEASDATLSKLHTATNLYHHEWNSGEAFKILNGRDKKKDGGTF